MCDSMQKKTMKFKTLQPSEGAGVELDTVYMLDDVVIEDNCKIKQVLIGGEMKNSQTFLILFFFRLRSSWDKEYI